LTTYITNTGSWAMGNPACVTAEPLHLAGQPSSALLTGLMDEKLILMMRNHYLASVNSS